MTSNLFASSQSLGQLCLQKKIKIAFAESCTGGMLSEMITQVSGSSAWFEGSVVAYSNAAKICFLNVPRELIMQYGAVSEPVAKAMAQGLLEKLSVDFTVAITGIAGPTGGSIEKPVGQVCFAFADKKLKTCQTQTLHFTGGRQAIRQSACEFSIEWLMQHVHKNI